MAEVLFHLQNASLIKRRSRGRKHVAVEELGIYKARIIDRNLALGRGPVLERKAIGARNAGCDGRAGQEVLISISSQLKRMDIDVTGRNRKAGANLTLNAKRSLLRIRAPEVGRRGLGVGQRRQRAGVAGRKTKLGQ